MTALHLVSTLAVPAALAALAPFAAAQWTATYAAYGAGCAGTGTGLGGRTLLPAAAATGWGAGNAIPLGWTPCRYQQVFLGNELPVAFTMAGLSLRQPGIGPTASGFTVDVEIRVGYTTRAAATMDTTFAANWDLSPPVTVLPRTLVDLPDQPGPPSSPLAMLTTIRWPGTFDWVPQAGRNLLVEITVFGNSVGNGIYGYPVDNVVGPPSIWGTPATATVANGGPVRGFGLVMGFDAQTHTAVPRLFSDDTPQIGNTFRVRVDQAAPATVALLLFGGSATAWSGGALPIDLGVVGAPGCALRCEDTVATAFLVDAAGAGNVVYALPNLLGVLGASFYNQAFVFDPAANAFGFVASNGGHGVFGNQ